MSELSYQPTNPRIRTNISYLVDEQETRPVGVRVVEPPADTRQAIRGNLYAVVELQGETADPAAFTERLLSVIQRTYYTVKGSQSQVLVETLREAENTLKSHNAQNASELQASVIVAALLTNHLLLVSNSTGLGLVTAGRNVDVYPPYTPDRATLESATEATTWDIYRQEMLEGGAFFLGSRRWLDHVALRELAGTVAYLNEENCVEAANALCALRGREVLPGLLILFTPGQPSPAMAAAPTAPSPLRRARLGGLPTALNASPPVHDLPIHQTPPVASTSVVLPRPVPSPNRASVELAQSTSDSPSAATNLATDLVVGAKTGLQRAREFLGNMLPDRIGTERPLLRQPELLSATSTPALAMAPRLPNNTATLAPRPQPFTPPPPTMGSRARLFITLAVLIVVLVPVIVAVAQLGRGANVSADAKLLLDQSEARLASAQQAMDAGDKSNARDLLYQAQGLVNNARGLLVGRSARADDLVVEIQRSLADVLQIQPLYGLVQPLVRFPAEAQPQRLLVIDQDLYVLDSGRQLVLRFSLDLATNKVREADGETIIRQGDTVNNVPVGRLVDITWQAPVPGVQDKPKLLILDRNNHMFGYDQRVEGISVTTFADQSSWRSPTHMQTYLGRLYLLDEGAGQILRYDSNNYQAPAEPWFSTQSQINLGGVQSLAIDGDLWLLYTNGMVLRYQKGEQVPFSLDKSIPPAGEPVDLAVGSGSESLIYLADRAQERILVFDKQGKYLRQLQAAEGNPLRGLSALFVDEVAGKIYILTQSALYEQALPN
jgi:hypothetical protein